MSGAKEVLNCWRIPTKMIFTFKRASDGLFGRLRSGAVSKSHLFLSLRIVLEPFIFFAHRMRLQVAIKMMQEEAGERVAK